MNKNIKLLILILLISHALAVKAADNLNFKGILRAHACSLHPDDGEIKIDFGEIGTRDLYLQGGTSPQKFDIRLIGCNLTVADEVQVTFEGSRSVTVPGALALDSSSSAGGVAIVLSDAAQTPLALGTSVTLPLVRGDNTLSFHRQLVVEPDALAQDKIVSGKFNANSNFVLFYP